MFLLKNVVVGNIIKIPYLEIREGKFTVILGESGSGKTTLLKLFNKLINPDEGEIFYKGENLNSIKTISLRREVVMLTQNSPLFPETIRDNLIKGLEFHKIPIPEDDVLESYLKKVFLNKRLDDKVLNLSGGEKSRIALARVLILEPMVYLLDEPSSALDEITEDNISSMLVRECKEKSKTIVMVTHSKEIAYKYGDIIVDVINGVCKERK